MKFQDYIDSNKKGKAAHDFEKQAMNDPFLSEALDGFDTIAGNHSERIAYMSSRIAAKSATLNKTGPLIEIDTKSGAWKIAAATIGIIVACGGYFMMMNHKSSMLTAHEASSNQIYLYLPQDYVDQKSMELSLDMNSKNDIEKIASANNISNLNEVIITVDPIQIYIPETYAELQKKELDELKSDRANKTYLDKNLAVNSNEMVYIAAASTNKNKETITNKDNTNNTQTNQSSSNSNQQSTAGSSTRGYYSSNRNSAPFAIVASPLPESAETSNSSKNSEIDIPNSEDSKLVAMKENKETVNESAVVGYGTSKKQSMVGRGYSVNGQSLQVSKTPQNRPSKPVGGMKLFKKYIKENTPAIFDADCANKKGTVVLTFNVDANGHPTNIKITKSLCEAKDQAAISLLKQGPKWTAGSSPVSVEIDFSI